MQAKIDLTKSEKCAKLLEEIKLSESDLRFIAFCREIGWALVEVRIRDGKPTFARVIERQFKFD